MTTPTVLIVDDEPLARWSIGETIAESGYRVKTAGDALGALEAMHHDDAVDVVLLDLRLPDSADLRVLSMMRRLSPRTPIILMTAYGSDALTTAARARGAVAVLNKPFDMNVLPSVIERAIAQAQT